MMQRYALVGLSAAVVVGVTMIPEDVLAARYSGARTAHYARGTAGRHVAYRATGVAGRGYRAAAYRGYRGAYGAAVGAAAVGAAAVAATSPWGYPYGGYGYGGYGYGGYGYGGYFAASPWGDYECRTPHGYPCNPHGAKNWYGSGTAAAVVARPVARAGGYGAYTGY